MAFVPLSLQTNVDAPEQGTEKWFELRKGRMTGSKPSTIMFDCTDEQSYNRLWAQYFGGVKAPDFDESQQAAVDWGSNNEDNACAEFIKQMQDAIVFETSLIPHPVYDWMAASPDGYIVRLERENGEFVKPHKVIERAAFEIKCPGSRFRDHEGNVMPHAMMKDLMKKNNPPYYYLAQCHFEMVMLKTKTTYFYMWTPWYSKLWKIDFDPDYWIQTVQVLKAFTEKKIPFKYLHEKIKAWKATSQSISRKYKPLRTFQHAPEGAIVEAVKKSTSPKIELKTHSNTKDIVSMPWWTEKDKDLLAKLIE